MSRNVLDASAVIAYLDKEPGHEQVVDLLEKAGDGRATLFMAAVNWGEVLYAVENARGAEKREEVELTLASHPIVVVEVGQALAKRAARLKARKKLPYLDCFVAALAEERRATLVTCDRDFQRVEKEVKVVWIGSAP
jgi:predicted nucleic acid-binding protein